MYSMCYIRYLLGLGWILDIQLIIYFEYPVSGRISCVDLQITGYRAEIPDIAVEKKTVPKFNYNKIRDGSYVYMSGCSFVNL